MNFSREKLLQSRRCVFLWRRSSHIFLRCKSRPSASQRRNRSGDVTARSSDRGMLFIFSELIVNVARLAEITVSLVKKPTKVIQVWGEEQSRVIPFAESLLFALIAAGAHIESATSALSYHPLSEAPWPFSLCVPKTKHILHRRNSRRRRGRKILKLFYK